MALRETEKLHIHSVHARAKHACIQTSDITEYRASEEAA